MVWCNSSVFFFRLVAVSSQIKNSEEAKADAEAFTEDAAPAEPATIHTAPDTFPDAAVSPCTL